MSVLSERVDNPYGLLSPEFYENPYPIYHRLRSEEPVHWSDLLQGWLITRYADVVSTLRDPRFSANRMPAYLSTLPESARRELHILNRCISMQMGFMDPPDHTRLRSMVNKAFTARFVEGMRPGIQELVEKLLGSIERTEQIDMIHDFAYPLPMTVISEMLWVPPQDRDQFKRWTSDMIAFIGAGRASTDRAEIIQDSLLDMIHYFRGIVEGHRRSPKDDLMGALIAAEDRGDLIGEEELIIQCISLLNAGHETTTSLIGNGILALLRHPDQLQKLKATPALIPIAIEELLRYESPIQRNWRVAIEDV